MNKAVKISHNLIGKATEYQVVAPGQTNTPDAVVPTHSSFSIGIGVNITWVGSLTAAPDVRYYWSPDGDTFFEDISSSPVTGIPTGAAPTGGVDIGPYIAPDFSKASKITVKNNDGSINISVLAIAGSVEYLID
jgi:hypothetical protein